VKPILSIFHMRKVKNTNFQGNFPIFQKHIFSKFAQKLSFYFRFRFLDFRFKSKTNFASNFTKNRHKSFGWTMGSGSELAYTRMFSQILTLLPSLVKRKESLIRFACDSYTYRGDGGAHESCHFTNPLCAR
jgi:hypothetical protein